jgi:hypothetical protein
VFSQFSFLLYQPAKAGIGVFDLNGDRLSARKHSVNLSSSVFNDLQQDFTNSNGLLGTQLELPTLRQAQLRPAYTASLSQLKLGQVSHPSQFFEVHWSTPSMSTSRATTLLYAFSPL